MQNQYTSITYRKDIDGLRAFAVCAVILYHAFPGYIPGGFIGVDIFFVISGFLITSILYKNLQNNNFNLLEFYIRRIKRIFPALLLVIIFCIGLGWFSLNADEYKQISKHARASSIFFTNYILAKEAGYFDVSAHAKPLMHLWSLAVEEQFYIFWPLIFYYVTRKKFNFIFICGGIISLSFLTNVRTLTTNPIEAFYFPTCRAWELISGALIAYLAQHKIIITENKNFNSNLYLTIINNKYITNLISFTGFIVIICSIIVIKKNNLFSNWMIVWPIIGTMLLLITGEHTWISKNILSNKICIWIGLISYPLYLWHWPLLSFSYIFNGQQPDTLEALIIIFISFILSGLTYSLVEQPIRVSKNKSITFILIILLILVGFFTNNIVINNGYSFRKVHSENNFISHLQTEKQALEFTINCGSPLSKNINKEFEDPYCMANSNNPRFLTIGDSHAFTFSHGAVIYNTFKMAMIYLTGHPPSLNYLSFIPSDHVKEKRKKQIQVYKKYLNSLIDTYTSVEYVILVSRGPLYISGIGYGIEEQSYNEYNKWIFEYINESEKLVTNEEAFKEGYIEIIKLLLSKGKKIIFVIDYPELGIDPATCFKRPFSFPNTKVADCILPRENVNIRQQKYREIIKQISEQIPSLMVYDPINVFCDQNKCYGKRGDTIYYRDNNHINIEGSKLLIKDFKNWLEQLDNNDH